MSCVRNHQIGSEHSNNISLKMVPSRLMLVKLVLVYTNVAQGVLDELFHKACRGQCGQGEGDCDKDKDCLPGLICDYDWWFNKDYCKAGIFKIY